MINQMCERKKKIQNILIILCSKKINKMVNQLLPNFIKSLIKHYSYVMLVNISIQMTVKNQHVRL